MYFSFFRDFLSQNCQINKKLDYFCLIIYPKFIHQNKHRFMNRLIHFKLTAALIACLMALHVSAYALADCNITGANSPKETIRGDVDGDGQVNISDVTALIDYLLGSGSVSTDAADVNLDEQINIGDVTTIIDYLLSGLWPEPEPIDMWYLIGDRVGSNPWENEGENSIGRGLIPLYPVGDFNGLGKGTLMYFGYFGANDSVMLIHNPGKRDDCWGCKPNGIFGRGGEEIVGIATGTDGYFNIMLNTKTNRFYFFPYTATTPIIFNTINIVGPQSDWLTDDPDFVMTKLNPDKENHNWIFKNFTVPDYDQIKFAANSNWDNNWGAETFPHGRGVLNGPVIPIEAGTYDVYFNDITGDYNFIEK